MNLIERLMKIEFIKNDVLIKKYGKNIHDFDLKESIRSGIVDRLMDARELGVPYCVIFGNVVPMTPSWDLYGNGDWNPPRDFITTDDIATEENDREKEKQNIYAFLRGEVKEKQSTSQK